MRWSPVHVGLILAKSTAASFRLDVEVIMPSHGSASASLGFSVVSLLLVRLELLSESSSSSSSHLHLSPLHLVLVLNNVSQVSSSLRSSSVASEALLPIALVFLSLMRVLLLFVFLIVWLLLLRIVSSRTFFVSIVKLVEICALVFICLWLWLVSLLFDVWSGVGVLLLGFWFLVPRIVFVQWVFR